MACRKLTKHNQIKALLDQTLETVEANKAQAYNLYEASCKEVDEQKERIKAIRQELSVLIQKVDRAEKELQRGRQGLVGASKNFSERDMQDLVADVAHLQEEWQELKDREDALRKERDEMEIRLHRLVDMRKESENLVVTIGSVAGFLNAKLSGVAEELESAQHGVEIGMQIIQAQEEERKRISRDLHDSVAQDLATIKMDLGFGELMFEKGRIDEGRKIVSRSKEFIGDCITNVRQVIFDMHPMALDDQGFAPAVHQLCQSMERRGFLYANYEVMGEAYAFAKHIEAGLYRIIQECFNNIVKHSGQNRASVRIHYTPSALNILVKDKGKGFNQDIDVNAEATGEMKHYGLVGIIERARHIGAQIQITPKLGEGVKIRIVVQKKQTAAAS
ncbi:sensor histidine kinase [Selenomonas sp. KH1T6]|uniref:sensor histidine kinase n=1 Tax=Selenomonas sp. KH1T6 TaxID=3158784 RepID=UPI0008A773E8|nr:two-component system, NarL family, sensor histidine kinase DegS [Selenomonas ruminantium]